MRGEYYLQLVLPCARPKLCPSSDVQPVACSLNPNELYVNASSSSHRSSEQASERGPLVRRLLLQVQGWELTFSLSHCCFRLAICAQGVLFRFENPTACGLATVWNLELGHGTSVPSLLKGVELNALRGREPSHNGLHLEQQDPLMNPINDPRRY